jgi:site-specific recombinase XerD
MARKTAQAVWCYADSTRINILNRNNISPPEAPAQLYLNRDGRPLTAAAMIRAISRANEDSTDAVKITAHVLRHLFACFYLKNAIEGQAAREGLTMEQLTYEQIEKIAEAPARTLQLQLGHTNFEDTAGYIKLVIEWWLTPKYFRMWNEFLDGQNA